MKIVSACLAGVKCRWDGTSRPCPTVVEWVRNGEAIPVCPEQLGGLPTPREPAEQRGQGVFTKSGKDVSLEFSRGAEEGLRIAQLAACKEAVLKARSPSCGVGLVYDGTFSGKLVAGDGVFAGLLKRNGISVRSEEGL